MELNLLERNILKAICMSSSFHFLVIEDVYDKCKSFDKTIEILKTSAELHISVEDALINLGYRIQ